MSEKENELYEAKIKLIQKENEIIMLNQRTSALERQVGTLRSERDKLIQISGDLKAQIVLIRPEPRNLRTPEGARDKKEQDAGIQGEGS